MHEACIGAPHRNLQCTYHVRCGDPGKRRLLSVDHEAVAWLVVLLIPVGIDHARRRLENVLDLGGYGNAARLVGSIHLCN